MSIIINKPAPDFSLPDLNGKFHHLSEYLGKIVVVNFWSCECPHSERTDKVIMTMFVQWREEVVKLPIASNRNESPQVMKEAAAARRLPGVLLDAECRVANLYDAQTTPHVFVIDRDGILRYHGAVDDATFRKPIPSRFFLAAAVDSLLVGHLPEVAESPAYGCTIIREV